MPKLRHPLLGSFRGLCEGVFHLIELVQVRLKLIHFSLELSFLGSERPVLRLPADLKLQLSAGGLQLAAFFKESQGFHHHGLRRILLLTHADSDSLLLAQMLRPLILHLHGAHLRTLAKCVRFCLDHPPLLAVLHQLPPRSLQYRGDHPKKGIAARGTYLQIADSLQAPTEKMQRKRIPAISHPRQLCHILCMLLRPGTVDS
mmetsp:Transcript_119172/g.167603  ORF Transcript_119172/g.167603 Transcript_119172/m.167603 type:complete len:202 (+) Transcript_119172:372-977(+)